MKPVHWRAVTLLMVGLISSGGLGPGDQVEAQPVPMNRMDHGPFVSSTVTLDPFSPRGIIVQKGIAVQVDREATMVFDTDLLRVVGAWTGGLLHWRGARDSLQEWPTPAGHLHFLNAEKAGWSTNGDLTDPRGGSATLNNARRSGPLPGNRRYEGLHVRGDDVGLSVRVRDARDARGITVSRRRRRQRRASMARSRSIRSPCRTTIRGIRIFGCRRSISLLTAGRWSPP